MCIKRPDTAVKSRHFIIRDLQLFFRRRTARLRKIGRRKRLIGQPLNRGLSRFPIDDDIPGGDFLAFNGRGARRRDTGSFKGRARFFDLHAVAAPAAVVNGLVYIFLIDGKSAVPDIGGQAASVKFQSALRIGIYL